MGREWSVLGEPDIKMYLVMSDSVILKNWRLHGVVKERKLCKG